MKNGAALKSLGEKSCEIKDGSQEMAAMMLILKNFINGCVALLKFIGINIIAAISWLPPLTSQLFSPRILKATPSFHSLAVFVWISLLLYFIRPQNQPMAEFEVCFTHISSFLCRYNDDY